MGTVAAVTTVLAEARLGPRNPDTLNPSSWWGILPSSAPPDVTRGWLAPIAALGVIMLCLSWCILIRTTTRAVLAPSRLAVASVAWSLPFALGPPLFSRDVYAYAGQGELARHGLDPATHGISALRAFGPHLDAFVAAVDPRWRETHAPYGGTAVFVEKTAAALGAALFGTGPIGAVLLLRLVAVISVVALVTLTPRLLPRRTRNQRTGLVLALLACNPITVIHLIGGAHLDALAGALTVTALVLDRHRRRWEIQRQRDRAAGFAIGPTVSRAGAVALACLAGTVKATAFLGLVVLLLLHLREQIMTGSDAAARTDAPRRATGSAAAAAGALLDLAVATATAAASMVMAGFGPTWIAALATSGTLRTGIAPATLLAHLISPPLRLLGLGGHADAALAGCRMLSLLVAAAVVAWLLGRAWLSPSTDGPAGRAPDDIAIVGVGGIAVALGSPVLYPWYLALALPALAIMIAITGAHTPRRIMIFISVTLCLTSLASLAPTWALLDRARPPGHTVLAAAALAASTTMIVVPLARAAAKRRGRRTSRR
ncbi:polyprenol phosphomannose-dependent alpha 1,6 mannosyltransferase MptB [Frankia sp. Cj5]|uniref:polyprenol phosphomannose-dependent alpha 1,6 mannosyltransferase MptB n=1 Tax=Frankia sp. Cj5 TaxID=2880978 RepID=UPI00351D428A